MSPAFKFLLVLICLAFSAPVVAGQKIRHSSKTVAVLPLIDTIVVEKSARRMVLVQKGRPIKTYQISLGFAPTGDKKIQGDGKTPEGVYTVNRRNPDSRFFLSLGISYPNAKDRAEARSLGRSAGGDIFIHGGTKVSGRYKQGDWTRGCIAVTNAEIAEIYHSVPIGTRVEIWP